MGGEWKDLAVHAKGADAELMAPLDSGSEGIRVVRSDLGQIGAASSGVETTGVSVRSRAKGDRRIEKLTAEAPADHSNFTIHSPTK
jgi:hypothetical protein